MVWALTNTAELDLVSSNRFCRPIANGAELISAAAKGGAEIHNDLADRRLFTEAGDAHADPLIGLNTHGLGGARWFGLARF